MDMNELRRTIVERRQLGGLQSSYAAIARWLFAEHGIVVSVSWVEWAAKT